jgi:hypothetical protein
MLSGKLNRKVVLKGVGATKGAKCSDRSRRRLVSPLPE